MSLRIFLVCTLTIACTISDPQNGNVSIVKLKSGLLSSSLTIENGSIRVFKGIPFAEPPVGQYRWRPPLPVKPWNEAKSVDEFGARCIQKNSSELKFIQQSTRMSEDCLYLNIWTASSESERQPVMVWIHGDDLQTGSGEDASDYGKVFARQGVVFITINYRLGPFGFLSHPLLREEFDLPSSSGNYGILDQIAALRWIKENISLFGGDPNLVTIIGQAAGSWSVSYLMASPLASGLFHRAIGINGGAFEPPGAPSSTLKSEDLGNEFVSKLIKKNGEPSLEQIRATTPDQIIQASKTIRENEFIPNIDGWIFPGSVLDIFEAGNQNALPVMIGSHTDTDFIREMKILAQLMSKENPSVYLYALNRSPKKIKNPTHPNSKVSSVLSKAKEKDARLSDLMISYWTNFISHGNPNENGLPDWPAYTSKTNVILELSDRKNTIDPTKNNSLY